MNSEQVSLESFAAALRRRLPGMMTKDPCGSMATRQALRMLGVSAAEMPHILQVSFRRLLSDCRFLLLSRMLQSAAQEVTSRALARQRAHNAEVKSTGGGGHVRHLILS